MHAMVSIAFESCLKVAANVLTNFDGLIRSTNIVAIAARKHALPDALNQFSSNSAPYGAGCLVTGGIWVIWLWSPGTISRIAFRSVSGAVGHVAGMTASAKWLIFGLIAAWPHASTKMTSSRYGLHARIISLAEYFLIVSDTG